MRYTRYRGRRELTGADAVASHVGGVAQRAGLMMDVVTATVLDARDRAQLVVVACGTGLVRPGAPGPSNYEAPRSRRRIRCTSAHAAPRGPEPAPEGEDSGLPRSSGGQTS